MQIKNVSLKNFASYDSLEFNFDNQGLVLVHGPTGAGKSTLQDACPWILTGETSKGGNVDEIRSWNHPKAPTTGTLEVNDITVTRIRGKQNESDLFWTEPTGEIKRGKDITETQKLLFARLNITHDAFITGSTFNEFSNTGGFFTAKGKDRRELFETLADLSLPIKLTERIKNEKTTKKKELTEVVQKIDRCSGRMESNRKVYADTLKRLQSWDETKNKNIQELEEKFKNFEVDKKDRLAQLQLNFDRFEETRASHINQAGQEIKDLERQLSLLTDTCNECGQPVQKWREIQYVLTQSEKVFKQLTSETNPNLIRLTVTQNLQNSYASQLDQELSKVNPFVSQKDTIICDIEKLDTQIKDLENNKLELQTNLFLLDKLQDITSTLRMELLRKSIYEVQETTNKRLHDYFDSEFKIGFELKDGDTIEVSILKGSNEAVYKQLSRGQRCLLRLCFVLSVQSQVSNKHGTHFDCLFFDEILDGCDETLKVKAYRVFEDLSLRHNTILLTDHNSEFKSLFSKKYCVTLEADVSSIKEDNG